MEAASMMELDDFDVDTLYIGVRDRLRDPEREVRQHALRVLIDLIPVTRALSLDEHMRALVPELLTNLGHSAPALRKSALDSLRKYLQHSRNYDELLLQLVTAEEDSVVTAAPFLINRDTTDCTLKRIMDHLWDELNNARLNQENVAKSLARIRYTLGEKRFKSLMGLNRHEELQKICNNFGLPLEYSDRDSDSEKMYWKSGETIEDRVILETEIKLKTGSAITMKLHEESRSNSTSDCMADSEEDAEQLGIVKILEHDLEFYEEARRTPRKVRFGGEQVKMRTPESDSSNQDDERHTLKITVSDALSIKTKKSLIPIRITSLPTTPRKQLHYDDMKRLHKSTPNLSRTSFKSKIPLKKDGIEDSPRKGEDTLLKKDQHSPKKGQNRRPTRRDFLSPTPHSEIEILHNLMRSPERKQIVAEASDKRHGESSKESNEKSTNIYESFEIQPTTEISTRKIEKKNEVQIEKPHETYDIFQIQPRSQILALPPPEQSQNNNESEDERFNSFQVVIKADNEKKNKSRTPSPFQDVKKSENILEVEKRTEDRNKTPSSPLEANTNSKKKKQDDEKFESFEVCTKQQILALPPPTSTAQADEADGKRAGKTDFSSFKVYPEEEKINNEENRTMNNTKNIRKGAVDISSFSFEDDFPNKSEALDNLVKMLKQPNTCETLEAGPASLLFEALFACQHLDKLHFLADDAIELMVKGLRPTVLEQCLGRLSLGICKVGAPLGVRLAMMIMNRTSPKKLQYEIVERCSAHKMREGALQVLMASSRALPSNEIEVTKITEFAALALRDKRRRVRQAALETLATLAQLSSNKEVLDIVTRITSNFQDQQYLLRVVRTRLSRRQLPTIESDGTIRYSTPRDQTEVDWLSGTNLISSPSSSASSSAPTVNYWKRNSRHEFQAERNWNGDYSNLTNAGDGATGNQQIWAIDPSVLQTNGHLKESNKGSNGFRPLYILQPEVAAVRDNGRRLRRKYDRGRSFSPSKPHHSKSYRHPESHTARQPITEAEVQTTCFGQQIAPSGSQLNISGQRVAESSQTVAGSAPQYASYQNLAGKFRQNEGFRKSFSSEQLFDNKKNVQENNNYFSLSSRSSNTSTGSSIRSGHWQKDMRSGIPVPIPHDKLRLRTGNSNSNIGVGPVIARRSILESPTESPVITRISPRHINSAESREQLIAEVPPPSSGSESSGYFTPPSDIKQAFVKLDTEDNAFESEESSGPNDKNNNVEDFIDSAKEPEEFIVQNTLQRNTSISSTEPSDVIEEVNETKIDNISIRSVESEREELRLNGFGTLVIRDPEFVDNAVSLIESNSKSKSVLDLHNFLPEINSNRKSPCSAPILKDNFIPKGQPVVITKISDSPQSASIANLAETKIPLEIAETEVTITRKLSRRLSRSQSKRSIKSTPRSIHESTPKSSRSSNKPKDNLHQALAQMTNPEWEVVVLGLQNLTKIAKYNPDVVEAQIHNVCVSLGKHIKNLRSQVARIACNTASELFLSCRKGLDIELEEIAGPLLHRTADTNKFLRADANAALDVMCEHLPPHRVIAVITTKGCLHQNGVVRAASMRLLRDVARNLGPDKIFQMHKEIREKLILCGANSLTDGSVEARGHGKSLISLLCCHHNFQKVLHDAVPQNVLRHIAKTLSTIKSSQSGT